MSRSQNIYVALATAEPKVANTLLNSMHKALPSFEVHASILLFGMIEQTNFGEFCIPVDIIDSLAYYPPIVDSRNICQLHLRQKMEKSDGIGFILDDDLLWTLPEQEFVTLIEQLRRKGCDMAFSALSGDSPIPKEYTRTSSLLDVLLAISQNELNQNTNSINEYLEDINTVNIEVNESNAHHDFYTFNKEKFHRYSVDLVEIKWHEFIQRLATGKATTRKVQLPTALTPASGRERGGATIVFNSDVLFFKNDAIRCMGLISRRSDMIMATDAASNKYKLFNTPAMLEHRRDEVFDTHDTRKLICDILGYSLVESKNECNYCQHKFEFSLLQRIEHTVLLLSESSKMLLLLKQWLTDKNFIDSLHRNILDSIIVENENAISTIRSLDLSMLIRSFNDFVGKRAE